MLRLLKGALPILLALGVCGLLFSEEKAAGKKPPPAPSGAEAAETPKDASAMEPNLPTPAARANFEKGKQLLSDGKYKDAEKIFKRLQAEAKDKDAKLLLEKWVQATAGGLLLERLKQQPGKTKLELYEQVQLYLPTYLKTPAGELYRQYVSDLEGQLFEVLEDFDVKSSTYSEKFGKTFIDKPELLLDGTQCLRWTHTKDRKAAALKLARVPADWTPYTIMEFWVNMTLAPRVFEAVAMCGELSAPAKKSPLKKGAAKNARADYFQAPLKISAKPGQWTRIRVPLSEFKQNGTASWTQVAHLQFQIPANSQFDFLVDKVRLVRKDEPTEGGAKADAPKAKTQPPKKKG